MIISWRKKPLDECPWLKLGLENFPQQQTRGGVREPFLEDSWWKEHDMGFMYATEKVMIHDDDHAGNFPRYTYFAMITNSGFQAKGAYQPRSACPPQRPGVIFCLDIYEKHHLVRDSRMKFEYGDETWSALLFGSRVLISMEDACARFVEFSTKFLAR